MIFSIWWWILTCFFGFNLEINSDWSTQHGGILGLYWLIGPNFVDSWIWQKYEIPAAIRCRGNGNVAPLGICYQEVLLSYSLEISVGYGIPFLKERGYCTYLATSMSLRRLTGFLNGPPGMSSPRTPIGGIDVLNRRQSWPKYPKTTWTLTKYLQQTLFPGQ